MDEEDIQISKSERKRQATHLQKLGGRLAEFKDSDLAALNLPEKLINAIADYRRFPSHEAKRRQLQYVGKLMRKIDVDAVVALVERYDNDAAANSRSFHELESWRTRLIADPQALTEYLNEYPGADRQRLRQALKRVHKAPDEIRQKAEARALFRLLREFAQPV